jgi:bacterioferritin-associated ferredoxin
MYVCLCYAVTQARVREAVEAGARDIADIGRRTGAGTDCGQCRDRLRRLMTDLAGPDAGTTDPRGGPDAGKR